MATPEEVAYAAFEDKVKRTVYLDNLAPTVTEVILKTALGQFGDVISVQFIPNYRTAKNISLYALVEMKTAKQAESIVSDMMEYPFMIVGKPRPIRARAAKMEMFPDRPRKPGREIEFRWVDPTDSDYEVACKLKSLAKKHAREDALMLAIQLEEEEKLAKKQAEILKSNFKKYEKIDKVMAEGTLAQLANWYGLNIRDD